MTDATRTRSDAPEVEESGFTWDLDLIRDRLDEELDRAPNQTAKMLDLAVCVEALNERREALARLVARLEAQVAHMSTEIRTRRLVVADPEGFERIVGETTGDFGTVRVASPKGVYVALVADEQSAESSAQVYLSTGDNGAGSFIVTEQGEYIDGEDGYQIDPDSREYVTSLEITPDDRDPRFRVVSLNREGLHFRD